MPEKGNSIHQVKDVLSQLHDAGVLNLDKSVREMLEPAEALASLQPGGEVATSVIAWDGYGLVIASDIGDIVKLGNVARQLGEVTRGAGRIE